MFKGGMAGMMQKAKQMQEDMEACQREIKLLSCEGDAGSGAVKVEMNGDYMVTNISIAESLTSDKEMLEDLIIILLMIPSTILGSKTGQVLLFNMNEKTFKIIFDIVLFSLAVRLLF